jgi:hypothetical protein
MKEQVGLWIDHKKAVIVTAEKNGEELQQIESNTDKQTSYRGRAGSKTPTGPLAEDHLDRKYLEHLNKYYDEVIDVVKGANSIFIFGPGEAKHEFEKRLTHSAPHSHVVAVESADKMTEAQIMAKVKRYYTV